MTLALPPRKGRVKASKLTNKLIRVLFVDLARVSPGSLVPGEVFLRHVLPKLVKHARDRALAL
jgi:hypothetical protein